MRPNDTIPAIGLLIVLLATVSANATRLPVIFIEQGTSYSPEEQTLIRSGLPQEFSQSFPNDETAVIVTHATTKTTLDELTDTFHQSQNQYFNGNFTAARQQLMSLERALRTQLPSVTFHNRLREIHRDVLIFLAMLAKEIGTTDEYSSTLQRIVRQYPNPTVSNKLFPPWIRDALARQAKRSSVSTQSVTLHDIGGCTVRLDGRTQAETQTIIALPSGVHTLSAHCSDSKQSFTSIIHVTDHEKDHVTDKPLQWHPIFYENKTIFYQKNSMLIRVPENESLENVRTFCYRLAQHLGTAKLLIAVKTKERISLFILQSNTGHFSQQYTFSPSAKAHENIDLTRLFSSAPLPMPTSTAPPLQPAKWYQKPIAWILLGTGLSLSATGIAMGVKYGSPSAQEPAIWMLQLSGVSLAVSGVTLLFIPSFLPPFSRNRSRNRESTTLGVSAQMAF